MVLNYKHQKSVKYDISYMGQGQVFLEMKNYKDGIEFFAKRVQQCQELNNRSQEQI